jgi:hypothetical protein
MDNSTNLQQNVVIMTEYQPPRGYAPLTLVEAYWKGLRAGREMPKRAEIDPRGIEAALEFAFILERVAPGVARMRIAGSHLHDLMGMEARGMPLTSFFEPDHRLRIAGLLEEVFQTPGAADIVMKSAPDLGQPALEARMVLLPLKSDLGDVSRILGCLASVGERGVTPRRFEVVSTQLRRLDSAPAAPAPAARHLAPQGLSEQAAAFRTGVSLSRTKDGKRRPAYLRLIQPDE